MTSTKPPGGTRDFLPEEIRRREHVIDVVRRVYERYGFEPLETPAFENIETLLGKYGDEGNKLIFKILRRGEHEASGEADLALRYDLTVPLARVIAQYQHELPRFFKRYQIQPVWRADRPARGRFREFFQCDIDAIGSTSPIVEAEQLAAVGEVLTELGFEDFTIRLNHRQVLATLLRNAGIDATRHADALVALDKLDKVGREGVRRELAERGIPDGAAAALASWIDADYGPGRLDWLETQMTAIGANGRAAFENVRQIVALSREILPPDRLQFTPSLARGLSYYTGAIFEVSVRDLAGSLGGGGRYDNLIGTFLGKEVPACGFSLGLERIIVVMTDRKMFPETVAGSGIDVMVTVWNSETGGDALALAAELRKAGLRVDVYPDADKLGKQFKYASSRQVPWVAVIGDDERSRGEVAIKNMRTEQQQIVPRNAAAAFIVRGSNRLEP
jgi:histidyl-tRNA synthetase